MILVIVLVIVLFSALEYLLLVPIGGFWSTYLFFGLIILTLISVIALSRVKKHKDNSKLLVFPVVALILYIGIAVTVGLIYSPIFRAEQYKNLLPTPKEMEFTKEITPFDVAKAPIVTKSTAIQIADKTISQDGTLGSRAEINSITLQNIGDRLYYVVPLEHSGYFAWRNNKGEGTPFILVDANNKECELIKSHIRYQPGAFFGQDLARKLFIADIVAGYTDFTFEVDDNKHPYWTASVYKNTIGLSGAVVTGIAVVDAESGEVTVYSVEDAPKWVDRIQPEGLVVTNINRRGKYVNGFSPFNNNNKTKATEGIGLVYDNGKCYYYTGITSVGKDESTLGFYLADTRTLETVYFRMSGATETAAILSAEGKVQNLGYSGSFPILLNVENKATYFVPLQDKNNLTKLYAMVSVEDHTVLGTGESVEECKTAYIKALFAKNQLENIAGSQLEITGTVKRIGNYTLQGNSYYTVLLNNSNTVFTVPLNQSTKLPITKEGDTVAIKYVNSKLDNSISTITFDNLSIK